MAAVPKHIIRVKHVFKQYNIPNDIFVTSITKRQRKSPGLEILKNVVGSDVVTETRISKIGNY